jgi:hypothetical protein
VKSVFLLEHFYEDEEYDIVTTIGVYSSNYKAQQAIEKLKKLNKFKDHPDDFIIEEYEIDKDEWTEGFFTI